MTALEVFTYSDQPVRTVLVDGEPWFVATDVASILGYSEAAAMTRTLDDDEKGLRSVQTLGGAQTLAVVNEPGLYSAIIRSRIPEAKAFKRWLTHEILPTIRKTGSYIAEESPEQFLARALTVATGVLAKKDAVIAELTPKAESYDRFMDSTSLIKLEVAARQAGVGRTTAYRLLRDARILQRWSRSPMQAHAHRFHEVASVRENSAGESVTDYTTKVRPEHFEWLVSTIERLSGKQELKALA